jgi:phosphoglycerate kinase
MIGDSLEATVATLSSVDSLPQGTLALDIGADTVKRFSERIAAAKTVFWNGPMGLFENPAFARGSLAIAEAVAKSPAFSVVGGGDSVAAVRAAGDVVADQIGFISTGGGASLELLEGKRLPGVDALRPQS